MEEFWVPKPGQNYEPNNIPRFLTKEEIEYVLKDFPNVKSGDEDATMLARNSIIDRLRNNLRSVVLDPSALQEFRQKLRVRFISSRIEEGENIGVLGANALGETVSQIALNTFHFSGSAGVVVNGIHSLRDLLFGFRMKKGKHTVIMPKARFNSFDEILTLRKELEGLSIGDLLISKSMDVRKMRDYQLEPWVHNFARLRRIQYSLETYAMRVHVNLNKMLIYGITMEKLSRMIKQDANNINIIYSPLSKKTLYILTRGDLGVKEGELEFFQMQYHFRDTIIPKLSNMYIYGVPLIEKIYPVSASVWDRSIKTVYREMRRSRLPPKAVKQFQVEGGSYIGSFWIVELNLRRMYEFKLNDKSDNLFEQLLDSLLLQYYVVDKANYIIYNPYSTEDINDFVHERKGGLPYIVNYQNILKKREPTSMMKFRPFLTRISGKDVIFPTVYVEENRAFQREIDSYRPGGVVEAEINVVCYKIVIDRKANLSDYKDKRMLTDEEYNDRVTKSVEYLKGLGYNPLAESTVKLTVVTRNTDHYVLLLKLGIKQNELKKKGISFDESDTINVKMNVKGYQILGDILKLKNELLPKISIQFSDVEDSRLKKYPFIVENIGDQVYLLINTRDYQFKPDIQSEVFNYLNNKGYGIDILNKKVFYSSYAMDGNMVFTAEKESSLNEYNGFPLKDGAIPYNTIDVVKEDIRKRYDPSFIIRNEKDKQYYLFSRRGFVDLELSDQLKTMNISYDYEDYVEYYFYLNKKDEVVYSTEEPPVDSFKLYGFKMDGKALREMVEVKTKKTNKVEELTKEITKEIKDSTKARPYQKWYIVSSDRNIDTTKKSSFTDYDLLSNPHIDPLRTYSNSTHNICEVLGVEAACYYLMNTIKASIGGNYIDPRHILLIADFIFNRGRVHGVIYSGLSRQPIGHLTTSTIERGMEVLKRHAPAGGRETISNVSSSIATGQVIKTGTGTFRIKSVSANKDEILEELPEELRKALEKELELQEEEENVRLINQEFGMLPMTFEEKKSQISRMRRMETKELRNIVMKGFQTYQYVEEPMLPYQPIRIPSVKATPNTLTMILSDRLQREDFIPLPEGYLQKKKKVSVGKTVIKEELKTFPQVKFMAKKKVPMVDIGALLSILPTIRL